MTEMTGKTKSAAAAPNSVAGMVVAFLLILNMILGAALAFRWKENQSAAATPPGPAAPIVRQEVREVGQKRFLDSAKGATSLKPGFSWRSVESTNYPQYIANLRAVQCPEETIQDIILAEVNKEFAARERALKLRPEEIPPWDIPGRAGARTVDLETKWRELFQEKKTLLRSLLGVDLPLEYPPLNSFRQEQQFEAALKYIPEEKRDLVRAHQEIYRQKMAEAQARVREGTSGANRNQEIFQLQRESREALAKILTPQEQEDLELRTHPNISGMRNQLGAVNLNEREFREIFRLGRKMEDETSLLAFSRDEASQQRRMQLYQEMQAGLKTILGESRHAEIERNQDWNFQNLSRIGANQGLSREAILKTYEIQQTARQHLNKLHTDTTLSADQRRQTAIEIQMATRKAMLEQVGQTAYGELKRTGSLGEFDSVEVIEKR